MLEFYLGATQFVLGDLPAPTIPSAKLTPAVRAQEKLGWRLGVEATRLRRLHTVRSHRENSATRTELSGRILSYQKVSKEIPKEFGPGLSDDELKEIRLKLDAAGVRLLTYCLPAEPPATKPAAASSSNSGERSASRPSKSLACLKPWTRSRSSVTNTISLLPIHYLRQRGMAAIGSRGDSETLRRPQQAHRRLP